MYKALVCFTEEEARQILEKFGLAVEERISIGYDGDRAYKYEQLKVLNPYSLDWEAVSEKFPELLYKAGAKVLLREIEQMKLNEIFKQ